LSPRLTAEELHAAASQVTGLDDFGPDDYGDGLAELIASYERDADLTPRGERVARAMLRGALAARLCSEAGWRAYPEHAQVRLARPLFVTGLPRTGTTALHRLLTADPAHQGLELWLAQAPQPRPPRPTWADNPVFQQIQAGCERHHVEHPEFIPPVHAGRVRADRGEGDGTVRTCDNRRVSTTGSGRRADVVQLAGELFAQKGYRATTVREIADAAGILSGSLYHHFDSKESIGDEILSGFINDVLADYRAAVASGGSPREVLEQIVRSTSQTLARHRPALAMLQNDWSYFSGQPRFGYLRKAVGEIERTWVTQLERGKKEGMFRADLDARLTYRLLRDVLWIPSQWRLAEGYSTEQVADTLLQLLFDGITARS
jgi:TetR/AcrR family transcriptional regulator, cholesterol catabolism regulator